jgi:ABC-type dipeptide/oligopeptide/nickel transport system ATPase subunit
MTNLVSASYSSPVRKTVATAISDRLSEELVIALVGPVGSGVTTTSTYIAEILKQAFSYNVSPIIKLSNIIKAEAHRIGTSSFSKRGVRRLYQRDANSRKSPPGKIWRALSGGKGSRKNIQVQARKRF